MRSTDPYPIKTAPKRRPLRDDPRYDELKRILENFPPEKMEELKTSIRRWRDRP
jgi:hypothetical protein